VQERVPLVICPFRSLLHMPDDAEKLRALRAARALLEPGLRLTTMPTPGMGLDDGRCKRAPMHSDSRR
jgi:hypothetical protein